MLVGVMEKEPKSPLEQLALSRHSAVSWIEQSLNQGNTLGRALALAVELDWGGRRYSARTLEGWLYEWRAKGFGGLGRRIRSDKGRSKVLSAKRCRGDHQDASWAPLAADQHTDSSTLAARPRLI